MTYHYFSKSSHPCSNFFHVGPYEVTIAMGDGTQKTYTINNSETHFMMLKAVPFEPAAIDAIAAAKTPKEARALGRKIKNYDENVWSGEVDSQGLTLAERSMDIALKRKLEVCLPYRDIIREGVEEGQESVNFVETSHWDNKWGTGMTEEETRRTPIDQWGTNLLGKAHDRIALDYARKNLT